MKFILDTKIHPYVKHAFKKYFSCVIQIQYTYKYKHETIMIKIHPYEIYFGHQDPSLCETCIQRIVFFHLKNTKKKYNYKYNTNTNTNTESFYFGWHLLIHTKVWSNAQQQHVEVDQNNISGKCTIFLSVFDRVIKMHFPLLVVCLIC